MRGSIVIHAKRNSSLCARGPRWLALLAFYVLGLVAHDLHFAQSRHVPCEHGDIEHSSSVADHDAGLGNSAAVVRGDAKQPEHGHHHCPVAKSALTASIDAPLAGLSHAPPRAISSGLPPSAPRAPSVAVFRIAPHHSPPTA